jgi:hypothetical protein
VIVINVLYFFFSGVAPKRSNIGEMSMTQIKEYVASVTDISNVSEEEVNANHERNKHVLVEEPYHIEELYKMFKERMSTTRFG